MKKILYTSLTLALLQTAALAHAEFTNHDFKGHYGYSFSAEPVAGTAVVNYVTEVGVFWADGHGHLTGKGNTMGTNGGFSNEEVDYDCDYAVEPIGTGTLTCTISSGANVAYDVEFYFVIDDESTSLHDIGIDSRQEVRFHSKSLLPFVPALGPNQVYHAIGSARRQ